MNFITIFFASNLCLLLSINQLINAAHTTQRDNKFAPILSTNKVFNYQDYMPIKDDRITDDQQLTQEKNNDTTSQQEAEAACWKLIHDQSGVTFNAQRKVLDELEADIKDLKIDEFLRQFIIKTSARMRKNMMDAEKALETDSADEYFDALFDLSEDIISLSSILREPSLSDEIFLIFVKGVSRLGRNNAALIQEFAEMCSFVQKSPKPKRGNFIY